MKTMTSISATVAAGLLVCAGLAQAEVGVTVRVGSHANDSRYDHRHYNRHDHARWEREHWEHSYYHDREPERVIVVEKKVYVPVPEAPKVEEPKPVEPTWSKENRSMNSAD
jgi:hypothetical protein